MAPAVAFLHRLLGRDPNDLSSLGPLTAHSVLVARDSHNRPDTESGLVHPQDINNNALFALFGLLGAAFVIIGIWFFFWAKNGGFFFREDDWDDYKSTVMRRKGPNGTILTGATPSTILGGGSIYKDVDDRNTERDDSTVISGTTGITGITGGVSDIVGRDKRRRKREQKERERERRREEKMQEKEERRRGKSKSRRKVGADGVLIDEEAEAEAKEQLRNYRHERPARVGGINKESEGSTWDGSTNPSYSQASYSNPSYSEVGSSAAGASTVSGSSVTAELLKKSERSPRKEERAPPKKEDKRGIRKVYSTADKNAVREAERLLAEARKMQERTRESRSSRRDFSWQGADESMALRRIDEGSDIVSETVVSEEPRPPRVPGSWGPQSDMESEVGTKVYRHPVHIPVTNSSTTSTSDFAYTEDKRKKRAAGGGGGYRRGRTESESGL